MKTLTDEQLLAEIEQIEENLQAVNARSSYAQRCRPRLRTLKRQARERGLL